MERRFVVVCEWQHIHRDCEFDADEIQVWAICADSAIQKAREKWTGTIGAKWPHIRLERQWILTEKHLAQFAGPPLGGDPLVAAGKTHPNDARQPLG
jgi:hypothetical protein